MLFPTYNKEMELLIVSNLSLCLAAIKKQDIADTVPHFMDPKDKGNSVMLIFLIIRQPKEQ